MRKRVLVTGSRGYSAQGIIPALARHGYELVGLDNYLTPSHAAVEGCSEVQGDVCDLGDVMRAMKGCQAVIHGAIFKASTQQSPAPESSLQGNVVRNPCIETYRVNVQGAFNVCEAARQYGVKQIVLLSSARVVWDHFIGPDGARLEPGFIAKADTPYKFSDVYGLSKHLQEIIASAYARDFGISVVVFRPWWVVDSRMGQNRYGDSLELDPIPLSPEGFVCRYDLGEACHRALMCPDIPYDIFYPVSGPGCERYFDVAHIHTRLGWEPRNSFTHVKRPSA